VTLFLASVTGPEEAEIALAGGADIIDLKDASKGALGALKIDQVRAAARAVGGRRPVSAVTGDLPMEPAGLLAAAAQMAKAGIDYVKIGLFPDPRREECIRALAALSAETKIVGVMFADRGFDVDLVGLMAECGFAGVMLDTATKGSRRLLDLMDITALGGFIAAARTHGLMKGLAGSLETPDVPRLLLLAPDFLGFRGALCVGQDRTAAINQEAVALVRRLIPVDQRGATGTAASAAAVDYRILAARGYSVDPKGDSQATDRIFVRDLVLPVRIGAYAHERWHPQQVRFNVDVFVGRTERPAEDMRDVFSYDVIIDGIRMIVAQGHVALTEMLAEWIAALLLSHARVMAVVVRVEKLEVGPGGVGVEIRRERGAEVARIHALYPTAEPLAAKAAE
jgi:(5-formylfuran-3-yl)methyl phosphate synthase